MLVSWEIDPFKTSDDVLVLFIMHVIVVTLGGGYVLHIRQDCYFPYTLYVYMCGESWLAAKDL